MGIQQVLSGRIPDNISMIRNLLSSIGKPLDDRKLQLEEVVGWLATSGRDIDDAPNKFIDDAQGQFINLLWNVSASFNLCFFYIIFKQRVTLTWGFVYTGLISSTDSGSGPETQIQNTRWERQQSDRSTAIRSSQSGLCKISQTGSSGSSLHRFA